MQLAAVRATAQEWVLAISNATGTALQYFFDWYQMSHWRNDNQEESLFHDICVVGVSAIIGAAVFYVAALIVTSV